MSTTPEDLAAFPNRYAVEREIEAAENPVTGAMHLNDGHERVRLPGGTLRRMLAVIDRLAAMASDAESRWTVIGWMRPDGSLHSGCPPINEPPGWHALLVDEFETSDAGQTK